MRVKEIADKLTFECCSFREFRTIPVPLWSLESDLIWKFLPIPLCLCCWIWMQWRRQLGRLQEPLYCLTPLAPDQSPCTQITRFLDLSNSSLWTTTLCSWMDFKDCSCAIPIGSSKHTIYLFPDHCNALLWM